MELVIKAAVIGVAGAIIGLIVKKSNTEMSSLLALAVSVLVIGMALELVGEVLEVIELAADASGLATEILTPVMKCVGIAVIVRLACDMCRDAGESSIASSVEFAGALCAVYVALPLIRTLLDMLGEFT